MSKHIIILLSITLLMASMASSQNVDQILQEVQKKYESLDQVCADFTQTFHWQLADETQVFTGTVCARGGVKFRIEMSDQTIVTDGNTTWTLSEANRQLIIDDATESTDDNPFLKSFLQRYVRNYKAGLVGTENINEVPHHVIKLTAKTDDDFVREIKVWIDKKSYIMSKIDQVDVNGNISVYEVNHINTEVKLSDNQFTLSAPSGYEVVDLR